ncbi:autophagy-related protein 13-domain-containing protein [Amylocystis lapponica]|nr:autophagy-related protein 13-domain-containing protein [Amylocystis lapponica]
MSNETQKADQIAHRFYTKLALVVHEARATAEPPPNSKPDKWFSLETPEVDLYKDPIRIYRSISIVPTTPPFHLQVLLCIPELNTNQVLVYRAPDSSRQRIDPVPKYILLESWDLSFTAHQTRPTTGHGDDRVDVAPPTMYKHAISLFRSIFTLLRILPTWKLARRLRRRGNGTGNFSIQLRVDEGNTSASNILGFDSLPAPNAAPLPTTTYSFQSIPHPAGMLTLSNTSLATPHFQLDALESLLSSRFLSLDEGPEFTPTLARHAQRSSASLDTGAGSGSPRSLPSRVPLPSVGRSPPGMSVADRFVVSPTVHSRTTSFPTLGTGGVSPRMGTVGLPGMHRAGAGSTSGLSDASSSRQAGSIGSRDDNMGQGVSALAARLRKESLGAGRSSDPSSSPGPLPIRRSPMHPVHPFKASTLSSSPSIHSPSPSLKQHSPLSSAGAGPSLPSRPPNSPTSSRTQGPAAQFRPSPTFAPSSLGDRRSLVSAEGVLPSSPAGGGGASPRMASGKRYSSSFGHRYAATGGAGSDGSAGSAAKDERIANASFLSTNTDDDDISAFVQDIDARRPLALRGLPPPSPPLATSHAHDPQPLTEVGRQSGAERLHETRPGQRLRTVSVHEPMLTTQSAVDARLAEMNATFAASLEGLSGRRRRGPAPLSLGGGERRQEGLGLVLEGASVGSSSGAGAYVRPRLASTGSARSGLSIASEEVLGRMDPEVGERER